MPQAKNKYHFLIVLLFPLVFFGQVFKTEQGDLKSLAGTSRYNVIFEYSENLTVPKYASENAFLEQYAEEKEKKEIGSGEAFKKLWFVNREQLFEPRFVQAFNFFNLKEKQITVARNISDAEYTLVVKTSLIDPGSSNFVSKKNARIEVSITIFRWDNPSQILYATTLVDVHSRGADKKDYDRIMSAYAELGRGLSKHLSRKT